MDYRPVAQDPNEFTPQPHMQGLDGGLAAPQPPFASYDPSVRDSYASGGGFDSPHPSAAALKPEGSGEQLNDFGTNTRSGTGRFSRRTLIIGALALAGLAIVATAVAVPVALTQRNKSSSGGGSNGGGGSGGNGGGGGGGGGGNGPTNAISGGDGSEVTTDDGTTFTYVNKHGGFWVSDPDNPWNNNAQPNSWTPPLNTSWDWSKDRILGVNLGGLFVLEPFISPALFEKYATVSPQPIDEWTLSQAMAADTSSGGGLQEQLENHYNTFITEQDIAQIAGAGLNWVRLPVGYWAIETWDGEPFLAQVSWKYILRIFKWCRKYGIRVKLDLHAVPGCQNVWNHCGKQGEQNFLQGVMGLANAQRTLGYIRIFTEFISQPEYKDVVPLFGIVNEPQVATTGHDPLAQFYYQAYELIREITGIGEGNGPMISYHEGFSGLEQWANFLPGADRIALDVHPYFAFDGGATQPVDTYAEAACDRFSSTNTSRTAFGVTVAGEWSVAINNCALFLNGVGTPDAAGCEEWEDSSQWDQPTKDALRNFALASLDSLQDSFFWTWKIGNSTTRNRVAAPLWSYQLGLQEGYMPDNARDSFGYCASALGFVGPQAPATLSSWQTGGAGAGTISPAGLGATTVWPPTSIAGVGEVVTLLPTFTQTGPVPTLPPPSLTGKAADAAPTSVDGWDNDADTAQGWTSVAGCSYPMAWDAVDAPIPAAPCTGPGSPTGTLETTSEEEETDTATTTTTTGLGAPPPPPGVPGAETTTVVTETVVTTDELGLLTTETVTETQTLARRGVWKVRATPAPRV